MIAMWMGFGLVTSSLLAFAGRMLEPTLLRAKQPVRGLWIGLMLASAVVFFGGAVRALTPVTLTAPIALEPPSAATSPSSVAIEDASLTSRNNEIAWPGVRFAESLEGMRATAAAFDRALAVLWLTSSALLGGWLLVAAVLTARTVRESGPKVDDAIMTDHLGPAAIGVLRPRILLPGWVLELEPALRALVMRHEREHVRTRDPMLLLGSTTLIVLMPWQVPLWWMARRLRLAIEFDCDARVLRVEPDVRRYATLLLLVSSRADRNGSGPRVSRDTFRMPRMGTLLFMSAASSREALRRRIEIMTTPRTRQRSAATILIAAGALMLSVCALMLPAPLRDANAQTPRRPTGAADAKPSTDSVIVFNYFLNALAYVPRHGTGQFIYALSAVKPRHDANAGFTTIRVTTSSGHPTDVLLYVERSAGERAMKTDTSRVRTPFTLHRTRSIPQLHLRSVHGDSLVVSSPAAVAPTWATRTTGVHFLMWGVNALGVVQR